MPLNFPDSPSLNQIYTSGSSSWIWDGTVWKTYSSTTILQGLDGATGATGATGPTGSAEPGGAVNSVQFNNIDGLSGAEFVEIANGNLCLHDPGTVPSSPAADKLILFAEKVADRTMPAYIGPSGLDSVLQPFFARNKIMLWTPAGNSTTISLIAVAALSATGTATSTNVVTTNVAKATKRISYRATAATNAIAGGRYTANQVWLGNNTNLGGFCFVCRFIPSMSSGSPPSTRRVFVGISSNTSAPTDVEPDTLTNCIGVCALSTSDNFHIIHNSSSGTATTIDLGANFAKNNGTGDSLCELALFSKSNSSEVSYQFRILDDGSGNSYEATGTITTNLPSNTTLMSPRLWSSSGGTNSSIAIDLVSLYLEMDY